MDFEHADAINQAIRRLSLRHRARAATVLSTLGLRPGQEVLLLELARSGPSRPAQLAGTLAIEPPSVTLLTQKLEDTGSIRRTTVPTDKRASIIELTDRGAALVAELRQIWQDLAEETISGLPAETVADLPRLLGTLTKNVDSKQP